MNQMGSNQSLTDKDAVCIKTKEALKCFPGHKPVDFISVDKQGSFRETYMRPMCINPRGSTCRAVHRLTFSSQKGHCLFCKLIRGETVKSDLKCVECKAYFCFNKRKDHFMIWHSKDCDIFRAGTWLHPLYFLMWCGDTFSLIYIPCHQSYSKSNNNIMGRVSKRKRMTIWIRLLVL